MKLNKLLYFAQGYNLALLDKPLFNDVIEAWQYGPVIKNVYQSFNNKENISQTYGTFSLNAFDGWTIKLLLAVIDDYGKYSSSKLIEITHKKNSPWGNVYSPNKNNIISQESIKSYFKNKNNPPSIHNINLDKIGYIGKRDNSSDPIILPKDWDDEEDYIFGG